MIKLYSLLEKAIEEGIVYGYARAYKYTDNPSEEALKEKILMAIMNELCEVIDFDATERSYEIIRQQDMEVEDE